jgi:hypothetical protein
MLCALLLPPPLPLLLMQQQQQHQLMPLPELTLLPSRGRIRSI